MAHQESYTINMSSFINHFPILMFAAVVVFPVVHIIIVISVGHYRRHHCHHNDCAVRIVSELFACYGRSVLDFRALVRLDLDRAGGCMLAHIHCCSLVG